ncbi:MAG TPA: hypothetical protein VMT43_12760 [Acidimicrobiales bacterium]|nr:hypothetical protein [Acidimicrobiales bacterium]
MAAPATTALNALTDAEEKILEILHDLQDQSVTYLRKAVERVESSLPELPTRELGDNAPSFKQIVDNQFVFAAKLLDNQHKFVVEVIEVTKPVTDKVVTQKPATGVRKVTKSATRKAVTPKDEAA